METSCLDGFIDDWVCRNRCDVAICTYVTVAEASLAVLESSVTSELTAGGNHDVEDCKKLLDWNAAIIVSSPRGLNHS
jgi:hypothetical protein